MKIGKSVLSLAALTLCAGAHAQVNLYGVVDLAVEHLTNTAPTGSGLTRMGALSGSVPSRLGFRGTEDLGGGLKANFTLESGIAADTGVLNQGGRMFGRQAWMGLSGDWGALTLGRQYTMMFWALGDADVLGGNIHNLAVFDSYLPNARADNAIAYRGMFGGLTVGGTYSLGRDAVNAGPSPAGTNCAGETPNSGSACRGWSAMAKYDTQGWGVAAAVDEIRGGPGAFAGLTSSALKDRRTTLNGYVKLGAAKVAGGLISRDNDALPATPRSDLWFFGASYAVTPQLTLDAQLSRVDLKSSANDANLLIVRVTRALSKRTAVYASASRVDNKGAATFTASGGQAFGNPAAGESQSAIAVGIRHVF